MKKSIILSIILLLLLTNSVVFARITKANPEIQRAINDAEKDVVGDTNRYTWFLATMTTASIFGCCGGSIVSIISFYYPEKPPASRFIGKSPDYITVYTYTYKQKMKYRQLVCSSLGCLGGAFIAILIW